MADKKISQLTTLAQADVAPTADFLPIVDTGSLETKKSTPQSVVLGTLGATTANVGIGTASPSYKLDVLRNSYGVTAAFRSYDGTNNPRLVIYGSSNGTTLQHTFSTGSPNLIFAIGGAEGAGTEYMRLDGSGNLGIGTASPVAQLSVQHASAPRMALQVGSSERAFWSYTEATFTTRFDSDGPVELAANNAVGLTISSDRNVSAGVGSLATTATDGFLYVPTCAGTPTGTPTAITGFAPIVVNTTNNKLYFYSGGAWRDAGP